jgi:hypothetical protein
MRLGRRQLDEKSPMVRMTSRTVYEREGGFGPANSRVAIPQPKPEFAPRLPRGASREVRKGVRLNDYGEQSH